MAMSAKAALLGLPEARSGRSPLRAGRVHRRAGLEIDVAWSCRVDESTAPAPLLPGVHRGREFLRALARHAATSGRDRSRSEIYYLCMALGFRGAYGVSGEVSAVNSYLDAARRELSKQLPGTAKNSDRTRARTDLIGVDRKSNALLMAVIVASLSA